MTSNPDRILHVPRRFSQHEWGGTEAVITNLCLAQQTMDLRPEIHTSLALAKTHNEIFKNIPVHRYPYCYPFFGLSQKEKDQLDKKGGNLLSLSLYRAMRKARNVRIYHAHVTKRTGGSVLKAAQLAKRPCVVTLHGNMFDVPKSEADDVVASQQGHFEWGRAFGAYFRSRQMLDEVDAVLCVGFSEYEKAKQILDPKRVHFLPNGVHPEQFQYTESQRNEARSKLGFREDAFIYGCISRIDPQKNQDLLIDAFCQLAADQPITCLVICGPVTSASYATKLQQKIDRSGFADRIQLLPPVAPDSAAKVGLFAALDTFVLPSRHEPFGIVILEAWSAGKPVIAAKVGGLARLITDRKTGLHFTSGNVEELTARMLHMLKEDGFRTSSVQVAQDEIKENYTWSQVAQQLEKIYQQAEEKYL